MSKQVGQNTLCVHSAHAPEPATGALSQPIYLTTTFERGADGGYPRGYRYSREGTPNRTSLEACIAALEGGIGAAAFASGLAANMAVLELLNAGDRLVAPLDAYYGSVKQFTEHVIHSGTKYLGGHSDVLSGLAVVREDHELLEHLQAWQRTAGAALAPFDCWLLRRSIATLALRVRTQCAGALQLAEFLARHPAIEQVFYPGLPQHRAHATAVTQMPGGFGAMLSVCVSGGRQAALETASRTRLFARATSLGGVASLIEHRASIEGPESRTPQNLLRLSVGIEEPADLIADLEQALE
ncbi:MAG: hypothetical protein E6K44_12085 [Gammaproteobacteria bacterium]|nr:MAG: hypothetical protein E6K44_12085 [Gammaproteobacteria bacterium]